MIIKIIKGKIEQFIRLLFINFLTPYNGSIIIVEYPKSGGTWLGQLVSGYYKIPFPRNKLPKVKKSLFHGHYLPKYNIKKNKKVILLVRDGRDVMVSLYHHQLLWNDKNKLHPKDVIYHRKKVNFTNFENVKSNMYKFIEYTFKNRPSKLRHFTYMGNWVEFNEKWIESMNDKTQNIYLIKYEDILSNTKETLEKLLKTFFKEEVINEKHLEDVIYKFSFKNQTNRDQGEEKKGSFLRKGIAGDWKNYFDEEAEKKFLKYAGNTLLKLGYIEK
ncbi:sulfotransferase domain-containing protein [Leptobacterium sp. I13]|uniref:sulfotransferase domain-containing protein n=1 Tax=Leptobacterium meishanense TaxID=3128904 RepID=UPI0030EDBBEF